MAEALRSTQAVLDKMNAMRAKVTESARAHSYISSSQVQKTCEFWLSTFVSVKFWLLTVPSALRLKDGVKSVFPHYSVKKYRSPWFSR